MSKISALTGNAADRDTYSVRILIPAPFPWRLIGAQSQAKTLYSQWSANALASDGHMRLSFDVSDPSFSLGYNIFWDLLLETGLLNTTVVDAQTRYIANDIQSFGVATDSTNTSVVSASEF